MAAAKTNKVGRPATGASIFVLIDANGVETHSKKDGQWRLWSTSKTLAGKTAAVAKASGYTFDKAHGEYLGAHVHKGHKGHLYATRLPKAAKHTQPNAPTDPVAMVAEALGKMTAKDKKRLAELLTA
jgi:hypothetical protein